MWYPVGAIFYRSKHDCCFLTIDGPVVITECQYNKTLTPYKMDDCLPYRWRVTFLLNTRTILTGGEEKVKPKSGITDLQSFHPSRRPVFCAPKHGCIPHLL
jgi:hypothetical protein